MTHHLPLYVIHENPEWFAPVAEAFEREGIEVREWVLDERAAGEIDLSSEPPQGVFWSRLSASAHTRGNAHAKEYGRSLLAWLEDAGRRVVGGRAVLDLEVSKAHQHLLLQRHGFDVPRTTAVFGRSGLTSAARTFPAPFIVKHNQGGKGFSVRRLDSHGELEYYVSTLDDFEEPIDGITLIQEYLPSAAPFVTRAEFVGGEFLYAVRVDTSEGSFELCPAVPGDEQAPEKSRFSLREDIAEHPIIARYEEFLADAGIEIAGIEFIETVDGRLVTYDINTNTNYNPGVEVQAERPGTRALVEFFSGLTVGREASALVGA
ncbi:alpha-L-glutamate ligase [Leucobacter weissii]|uniref:Alpha-L-glutamate ligase n=1 Tax=Leucobacter weissii TaxID=1983706 RepID=A0A939S9F9_9MICO|nr:alpha-L-glutamate ligase [Leucobacter weissii]MBO1903101.1 alpha-L-glutamate ligase [Leucobacter weissii]